MHFNRINFTSRAISIFQPRPSHHTLCTDSATNGIDNIHKYILAHSSWFCLPDQGMQQFELLSRGSSFLLYTRPKTLVNGRSSDDSRPWMLVTAAHVAFPFRYRHYYPQADFLDFVTHHDCVHKVDMLFMKKQSSQSAHDNTGRQVQAPDQAQESQHAPSGAAPSSLQQNTLHACKTLVMSVCEEKEQEQEGLVLTNQNQVHHVHIEGQGSYPVVQVQALNYPHVDIVAFYGSALQKFMQKDVSDGNFHVLDLWDHQEIDESHLQQTCSTDQPHESTSKVYSSSSTKVTSPRVTLLGVELIGQAGSGTEHLQLAQRSGTWVESPLSSSASCSSSSRAFVRTDRVTVHGMCGGPAVVYADADPSQVQPQQPEMGNLERKESLCVGMLEGLVVTPTKQFGASDGQDQETDGAPNGNREMAAALLNCSSLVSLQLLRDLARRVDQQIRHT